MIRSVRASGWFWPFLAGCLLSSGAALADEPEGLALRRWAILASPQLQQAGVDDLLLAKLSGQEGLELIERETLRSITEELSLAAANSQGAAPRLELGHLLKADALVLLSLELREEKPSLRIVLSECRHGARLYLGYAPYREGKFDEMAAAVTAAIEATRQRFARGVQRIVGVSNFVSKNLVHDYDHYQAGLAGLLQAAFVRVPGVAVIEIDEALAIRRELELTADAKVDRLTPWLVSGEFTVAGGPAADDPQLNLSIKVSSDGGSVETVEPAAMSLAAATEFLSHELPRRIRADVGQMDARGFSAPEQFTWLVARADEFASLGAWEQSLRLREAALLIEPDNLDQRTKVKRDRTAVLRLLDRRLSPRKGDDRQPPGEAESNSIARQLVDQYIANLAHNEHLLRRRLVHPLVGGQLLDAAAYPGWFIHEPFEEEGSERLRAQAEFDRAEQARQEFLRSVLPLFAPQTQTAPAERFRVRQSTLARIAMNRCDRRYLDASDLEFLRQLMEKHIEDEPPSLGVLSTLYRYEQRPRRSPAEMHHSFTPEEWLAFLERLCESQNKTVRLFGQYGRLRWTWEHRDELAITTPFPEWMEAADTLIASYREVKLRQPNLQPHQQDSSLDMLLDLRHEMYRFHVMPEPYQPRRELPIIRKIEAPKPAPPAPAPRTEVRLSLRSTNIEVAVRDAAGREVPWSAKRWSVAGRAVALTRLTPCGDQFDVMWNESILMAMVTPGVLEEWFADPEAGLHDVRWDGKHLWLATRRKGMLVYNAAGNFLARIGADEGLPPCDRTVMLEPVAPGLVCAVGSFGQQGRAWCARVELAGKKVHVFHEATKVDTTRRLPARREAPPANGAEYVFDPTWLVRYNLNGDERKVLLVGRGSSSHSTGSYALAIDLDTWEISVEPTPLPTYGSRGAAGALRDGKFVVTGVGGIWIREPGGAQRLAAGFRFSSMDQPSIITVGDDAYVAGRQSWQRIPLDDPGQRPVYVRNYTEVQYFGQSVHYGLVGWAPGRGFARLKIEEEGAPARTASVNAASATAGKEDELHEAQYRIDEELLSRIQDAIARHLAAPESQAADRHVVFSSGAYAHDRIPIPSAPFWMDPPEKREGLRLHFRKDGLLARIDSLKSPMTVSRLFYDSLDHLQLIVQYDELGQPKGYLWVETDDGGNVRLMGSFSSDFKSYSVDVYERHDQQIVVSQYWHDGRLIRREIRSPQETVSFLVDHTKKTVHERKMQPLLALDQSLLQYGFKSHLPRGTGFRASFDAKD